MRAGVTNQLRKIALSLLAISTLFLFNAGGLTYAASAGSANGFSISPVISQLTINKGQSASLSITIQNPSSLSTTAQPIVNDFVASSDESGTPRLILNNNIPLPANNFKLLVNPISNVSLGPNQQKIVTVTISVPSNAASGGYYGAIRFIPVSTNKQGNVGLTASVGTLVLVTVPGNLVERVDLVQLSGASNGQTGSIFTGGNLSVITRLENTGNIHTEPFGVIAVKGMFSSKITDLQLNNTNPRGNILPDSIRKFNNPIPGNLLPGRYTVTAFLGYGSTAGLIQGQATFWYLPVWTLFILAVIVVVIVALIYWIIHSIRVRRFSKSIR